jgi:translation initiation factor 3 subunit D
LGPDFSLIARCEIDGASKDGGFLTIKALNEFDPKAEGWRKKIDSQKGAVLGTELKNNSNKLAKWTLQSLLAGTSGIKLGFVSRQSAKDIHNHVILGVSDFKPKEFASQINLNTKNAWGILTKFLDIVKKLPDGKYILMRDPERNGVRLYHVPDNAFDKKLAEKSKEEEEDTIQEGEL